MRLWFALCLSLGLSSPLFPADGAKLVVISIDGLDYRYLKDADRLHLKIPVLRKMMAHGAVADGVVGFPPTESWPAVTSIVTGVSPAQHGVLSGARLDQTSKSLTLWQAAARAHKKTVLLNWPATAQNSSDFVCPPYWEKLDATEIPFEPMSQHCTPGLVGRIASVYPRFTKSLWNDESAMTALSYLLQYEQPDFSLVHLTDLDVEERETGALSLFSREVLENGDELLGQMLTNLPPQTVVAVVSGNGYETQEHVVRPRVLAKSASIEVKYGLIGALDATSAASLRRLLGSKKNGLSREVPLAEVTRYAPDLKRWVAAFGTQPGYIAVNDSQGPGVGPGNHRGVRGQWPTRNGYRSVFVLSGSSVRSVHLGEISVLAVAPTLASVLGVNLPDAREPSLWGKLKK
jgi:hypothetical protein